MDKQGLRFNSNKPKYSILPLKKGLLPAVRAFEYGEHKYSVFEDMEGEEFYGSEVTKLDVLDAHLTLKSSGRDNWKLGLNKQELIDSTIRHLIAYNEGEEFDDESKVNHIGLAMANLAMLSHLYIPEDNIIKPTENE